MTFVMKIKHDDDDSISFIEVVEQIVVGLLHRDSPPCLVLIKIDNWFGSNWLSFSGKALGAMGVWRVWNHTPTVPPFVPSRVIRERHFLAPTYNETAGKKPLHKQIPANAALTRRMSEAAPDSTVVWYSGKTKASGRGSVMAYVPQENFYWSWYSAWDSRGSWRIVEAIDIKQQELLDLMEPAAPSSSVTA
jgi:hypothetical protein